MSKTNNTLIIEEDFDLNSYFESLKVIIQNILLRPAKETITYDILSTEKSKKYESISLKEKQRQMKIGEIWQEAIGNYDKCVNLKIGHETGLDILSEEKKFIIELKNRTNTDNSSSRKANFDKLSKFKINHPEYRCIYANINADSEKKTLEGYNKTFIHNNVEIEHLVGYEFLTFIFEENTELVIQFLKNTIDQYI